MTDSREDDLRMGIMFFRFGVLVGIVALVLAVIALMSPGVNWYAWCAFIISLGGMITGHIAIRMAGGDDDDPR